MPECEHLECATEAIIATGIETMCEGLRIFQFSGWGLSPQMQEELTSLHRMLNEIVEGFAEQPDYEEDDSDPTDLSPRFFIDGG